MARILPKPGDLDAQYNVDWRRWPMATGEPTGERNHLGSVCALDRWPRLLEPRLRL